MNEWYRKPPKRMPVMNVLLGLVERVGGCCVGGCDGVDGTCVCLSYVFLVPQESVKYSV